MTADRFLHDDLLASLRSPRPPYGNLGWLLRGADAEGTRLDDIRGETAAFDLGAQ
jgi:hypothetical protein